MIARLTQVLKCAWVRRAASKERMDTLVAMRSFSYDGRLVVRGQVFHAQPNHARLLKMAKRAIDFVPPAPDASQDAASPSERTKRKYKRRDMEAE